MIDKIKSLITWKLAIAIIMAIIMYFAPSWLVADIEQIETALDIPVIELKKP